MYKTALIGLVSVWRGASNPLAPGVCVRVCLQWYTASRSYLLMRVFVRAVTEFNADYRLMQGWFSSRKTLHCSTQASVDTEQYRAISSCVEVDQQATGRGGYEVSRVVLLRRSAKSQSRCGKRMKMTRKNKTMRNSERSLAPLREECSMRLIDGLITFCKREWHPKFARKHSCWSASDVTSSPAAMRSIGERPELPFELLKLWKTGAEPLIVWWMIDRRQFFTSEHKSRDVSP